MNEPTVTAVTGLFVDRPDRVAITGVTLRELKINRDPRGTLTELLRVDWADVYGDEMPFAQTYVSVTGPGVARDDDKWHVHQFQTDRFYCLAGEIVVVVADVRSDSPSNGVVQFFPLTASADAPAPFVVTIPPRTLHGFVVTSATPAMLMNFPNRLYNPEDEGRVPLAEVAVTIPGGIPFSYDLIRRHYGLGSPANP